MVEPYQVACMQTIVKTIRMASDRSKAKAIIKENLRRNCELVDDVVFQGRIPKVSKEIPMAIPTKLIVFPEAHLSGFPYGDITAKEWMEKGCCYIPGEESDVLSERAKKYRVYICGHAYEVLDDWSGIFFNTAYILDPSGKVALKYRKFCSTMATTPLDVFDEYIKRYGVEAMFPVVDTPIGKLAGTVCCDYMYPEVWRCLAMNGAEVICHPTGGPVWLTNPGEGRELMRKSRAVENTLYIAYAHMGRLADPSRTEGDWYGHTGLIDYEGKMVAEAPHAGEMVIRGIIDIQVLRRRRAQGFALANNMNEAFIKMYERHIMFPANKWLKKPNGGPSKKVKASGENLRELFKKGVFTSP
jgi:predicted amidohydrolase